MTTIMKNLLHHRHNSDASNRKSSTLAWRESHDEAPGRSLRSQSSESIQDLPPLPPPKDLPMTPTSPSPYRHMSTPSVNSDAASLFRPGRLSRAGSVYTLSRVSFAAQIRQLTDIQLPDAEALRSSVSAIPTAQAAAQILLDAAEQIQRWVRKASDVLNGLDAGDDAEWAAAAGRDGLVQVDQAITRFQSLVNVYIGAVEDLQLREDAQSVPTAVLEQIAEQVGTVSDSWQKIRKNMSNTKLQVELAMEWQSLLDVNLGEIGSEMEELSRAVFEMEEHRHQAPHDDQRQLDIGSLESMVQDLPSNRSSQDPNAIRGDVSYGLRSPSSSDFPSQPEERNLLGLFARLQPLRAQIEFLPMQMSAFNARAEDVFPSACQDLEDRRSDLEAQWWRLESDAEALQKELADDRWNVVFRNASKQALTMIKSVKKSLDHVDEAVENNVHLRHSPSTTRKIEQYEARKQHYMPAIERVLLILDRGVKNRLTVNGEISRLEENIRSRWRTLQHEIKHMDSQLEEYTTDAGMNQQQLRDSVSTILSGDHSQAPSSLLTPGTSPPSSIAVSRKNSNAEPPTPLTFTKPRQANGGHITPVGTPSQTNRYSSLPVPSSKRSTGKARTLDLNLSESSSSLLGTPPSAHPSSQKTSSSTAPPDNRPRWTYTKTTGDYNVSDYYRSLMSKGRYHTPPASAVRHSSAPYQNSLSTPSPKNSPLTASSRLTPSSATPSRPTLNRKRSDLTPSSYRNSLSTPMSAKPRATTSMGSRAPSGTSIVAKGRNVPLLPAGPGTFSASGTARRRTNTNDH